MVTDKIETEIAECLGKVAGLMKASALEYATAVAMSNSSEVSKTVCKTALSDVDYALTMAERYLKDTPVIGDSLAKVMENLHDASIELKTLRFWNEQAG